MSALPPVVVFRAAVAGDADLHADLVDEDDGGAGLVDGAGQLAEGVGHQAGVPADLRFAHCAFEFGLGDEAATESMTTRSTAPERTSMSAISRACSPWSGCEMSSSSVLTPRRLA